MHNKNIFITFSIIIFSIGVVPYLLILIGLTNIKKIKLEKEKTSTFSESNYRVLYVFLIILFILGTINLFPIDINYKYSILLFLGLIGVFAKNKLIKFIVNKFTNKKFLFIKKFTTNDY